ncbi:tRNA(Met) cytidine acetate ligase [Blautia difficilis]|uniref:tRNA(Met) cytidine acetate ligase n=1 Tax=Blautia difficilis TaxID=2763027 RepID=UPI003D98506A
MVKKRELYKISERSFLSKFMKTAGIIAEYNPFHKGHEYQIRYTKEKLKADYVIVAMSGDYVQRGTPALISKHVRAEMALRCGADLVLEIPVSISTASAEAFAMGGVSLLDSLGVVDMLCFGSESGEISALRELAEILVEEPEEYKKLLKSFLSEGLTFPAARSQALTEYFKNPRNFNGDDFDGVLTPLLNEVTQILNTPNNILGIEYCKALLRLNSQIRPVTIRREGMGYHETTVPDGNSTVASPDLQSPTDFFASATAIRNLILRDSPDPDALASQIPGQAFPVFQKAVNSGEFLTENSLDSILSYCLMKENVKSLSSYMDVSEDLARRIINQQNLLLSFSQSVSVLKTRELTQTRIQRALLHIILNIHTAPTQIPFARVLGFRRESSELLSQIKKHSRIPLITKLADAQKLLDSEGNQILSETVFSSNLYEKLLCLKTGRKFCHQSQKQLIII